MDREMSVESRLTHRLTVDAAECVHGRRARTMRRCVGRGRERTCEAMNAGGPAERGGALRTCGPRTRLGRVSVVMDERWESLLECASDLVVIVDAEGRISHVNHVSARLSGSREGVIGHRIYDFVASEYRVRVREAIESVLQTGQTTQQVVCFSGTGGDGFCSEASIGPIHQDGRTVAVAMFFTDITARQRLQTRLQERDRLLRSIVRAVPRMMDIVEGLIRDGTKAGGSARRARELELCREQMIQIGRLASIGKAGSSLTQRFPQFLTAIGMSVENAIARLDATSRREGAGRELEAALRTISDLAAGVERLRGFAETGSRSPLAHAVDLRASLVRVVPLLEARARGANTAIRIGERDEWPQVCMAEGDAEQLFFALIENLLRFADGRRHDQELVHVGRAGDDGLGEKEDSRVALDRPYPVGPVPQAVDLGLYVASDIVIRAGGTIRRESTAGSGSTFFVCLPILDRVNSQGAQSGGKRKTTCFCRR